jgi:tryptophan synthase alpha chain
MLRRHLDLPIGVGFAIRDAATARAVAAPADAVIVGSALVDLAERVSASSNPLTEFLREIRAAIDEA